jgi:hypothetical protein
MSMSNLAYARIAFQSFSRSARHIYQLIAGHQSLQTGWAYLSYACLSRESGLTPRRVMQLVAFLEANHALEVRRGHGRGHVNFYQDLHRSAPAKGCALAGGEAVPRATPEESFTPMFVAARCTGVALIVVHRRS